MKQTCLLMFLLFNVYMTNAQERFFSFTEGWIALSSIEYEDSYSIIGMNFTTEPTYIKYIQFSTFDKSGNPLSKWNYLMDSTISTEIRNQQSFSSFGGKHLMGITTKSPPDLILIAQQLTFNKTLTEVIDSSTSRVDAITYVTRQVSANKILQATDEFNGSKVNSVLFETDTLGNTTWEHSFACEGNCWMEPRHIIPAHDGGYIFTNTEQRLLGGGGVDDHDVATIIKTDSLGVEQWRIYPGGLGMPYTSEFIVLQPTDDGNYLCAWADNFWRTSNFNHYNLNPDATMWFAKIAPDGSKIWEKNIQASIDRWDVDGAAYIMEQMIRTSDDNFVIITSNKLFKINQEAEIIWARNINPLNLEFSYEQIFYYKMKGISHTSDGGFIATGEFVAEPGTVFPEYIQTGFVLKLDEYGCYEADCHLEDPVSTTSPEAFTGHFMVYPNPAKEFIIIKYDTVKKLESLSVVISDLNGRQVHHEKLMLQQAEVIISTDRLSAGQYFITLHDNDEILTTEKFILVE